MATSGRSPASERSRLIRQRIAARTSARFSLAGIVDVSAQVALCPTAGVCVTDCPRERLRRAAEWRRWRAAWWVRLLQEVPRACLRLRRRAAVRLRLFDLAACRARCLVLFELAP